MQGGARVGQEISVLDDEEVTAGVGWNDFEGKRTEPERVETAGTVLAGGDGMEGKSSRRFGRALRDDVLESYGGEEGRRGFEEGAAGNGHGGMVLQSTGNREWGFKRQGQRNY
jgi:hypothetical protein